jgi:hypothetical protein
VRRRTCGGRKKRNRTGERRVGAEEEEEEEERRGDLYEPKENDKNNYLNSSPMYTLSCAGWRHIRLLLKKSVLPVSLLEPQKHFQL